MWPGSGRGLDVARKWAWLECGCGWNVARKWAWLEWGQEVGMA